MQHQLKPGRLSNRDPLTCLAEHYLLSSFSKALPLRHTKLEENQENEKWCADMKILPHEQENMIERVVSYVNQVRDFKLRGKVYIQLITWYTVLSRCVEIEQNWNFLPYFDCSFAKGKKRLISDLIKRFILYTAVTHGLRGRSDSSGFDYTFARFGVDCVSSALYARCKVS